MTLVLLLSVALGGVAALRLRWAEPVDRLVAAVLPAAVIVLAGLSLGEILGAPLIEWNDVRLAPSAGLWHGYPLYTAPGVGVLLGHIYGPISPVFYLPAALLPTPSSALAAGVVMAILIYALPVGLLVWTEARRDYRLAVIAVVVFGLFSLYSRILYTPAYRIHADAPALGLAALACAFVYRAEYRQRRTLLAASALAAILAVGSKQVMLPVVPALLVYIGVADGWKVLRRYILIMAAVGTATLAVLYVLLDFEAMILNTILIPRAHPWKAADRLQVLEGAFRDLAPRALPFALVILGIPAYDRLRGHGLIRRPRAWLRDNSWTLPALVGVAAVPTALLGRSVFGGSMNALAFSLYFLVAAAILGAVKVARRRGPGPERTVVMAAMTAVAVALTVALAPGLGALPQAAAGFRANPEEEAYRFVRANPEAVYLPFKPLIALLAEGRAYHFSYGVRDREMGGIDVDAAQWREHLPAALRYVLIHREHEVYVMQYLPEFDTRIDAPELPGWRVLTRRAGDD